MTYKYNESMKKTIAQFGSSLFQISWCFH